MGEPHAVMIASELPRVTIVTPTFHHAAFIEDAVRSVAAQSYANIEYIIVDGGSDAETASIAALYPQVIARYLRGPDRGQAHAINKGWRLGSGEILAWLNADDFYFPDAVARAVRAFGDHPEIDLLYGDAVYVDLNGQFLRYFTEVEVPNTERLCNVTNFIAQPAAFVRRRAIERVGFLDESLHYTMDWDLWCRLSKSGCRLAYDHHRMAAIREHSHTKTLDGGIPRLREILRVNGRHRTRFLPWAFAGFAGDLLYRRARALPGAARSAAIFDRLRAAKSAFTGGTSPVRPLYGLHHRTALACREASVALPTPAAPARWVELHLGLPPGLSEQHVEIVAGNKTLGAVELRPDRPQDRARVVLDNGVTGGQLNVTLRAEIPHQVGADDACFEMLSVRHGQ